MRWMDGWMGGRKDGQLANSISGSDCCWHKRSKNISSVTVTPLLLAAPSQSSACQLHTISVMHCMVALTQESLDNCGELHFMSTHHIRKRNGCLYDWCRYWWQHTHTYTHIHTAVWQPESAESLPNAETSVAIETGALNIQPSLTPDYKAKPLNKHAVITWKVKVLLTKCPVTVHYTWSVHNLETISV